MNWEAIGAVGEVGGAIAVVATLVYLAAQIRHSAESNLASTQFGIQSEFNRFHEMVISDPELLVTLERAATGGSQAPARRPNPRRNSGGAIRW